MFASGLQDMHPAAAYGIIRSRVETARSECSLLTIWGHVVINPLALSEGMEANLSERQWLRADLRLVRACEGVVVSSNWQKSRGCRVEVRYARLLGMPVYTIGKSQLEVLYHGR